MVLPIRHGVRAIITLAALAASTALVACGGSEASGEDAEAKAEDAALEFAKCMREHGIDIPDPQPGGGPGGGGFEFEVRGDDPEETEKFQDAEEACGDILEKAIPEGERPDPAEMRDKLHEMTECLRDKGYDVPEPQIFGPGEDPPDESPEPPSQDLQALMDDSEFQDAQEACSKQAGLPGEGPGLGLKVTPGGGGQGSGTSSSSGD